MTPPELVSVTVLTCRRALCIDDLTFPTFLKRSQTKMDVTIMLPIIMNSEVKPQERALILWDLHLVIFLKTYLAIPVTFFRSFRLLDTNYVFKLP